MYVTYIMKRTQIYLDDEQHARLRERASAEDTTVSDVIRRAVDAALRQPLHQDTWSARWRDALAASAGAAPDLPDGVAYVDEARASERRRRDAADVA